MSLFIRAAFAASTIAIAAVAPLAAQAPVAPAKIAYVDTREIMAAAPGRAEAEAAFQKEVVVMQQQVKRMSDSLNAMVAEFQKVAPTLTQAQREKRQKDLEDKRLEYQERSQGLDQQAQSRQAELLQPILDQIKLVLEDVRADGGYTFILDIGQGSSGIVAADKNLNISERVIAKLRTMPAPAVAAKKDEKAVEKKPAQGAPLAAPAGVTRPKPGENPLSE
jgi:outer membrane protein